MSARRTARAGHPPLVLHVLPGPLRRGAQRYATELVRQLEADGSAYRHVVAHLFPGADGPRAGEVASDRSPLRRIGLDPAAVVRLRRALRDHGPAIVVAHGGEPLKYAALSSRRAAIVYLKIGCAAPAAHRPPRRWWHRWLVRRAAAVVGVSATVTAEAVEGFGARAEAVRTIPNGRDPTAFPGRSTDVGNDPPVLAYVGHMTATKRPLLFLEVVDELSRMGVSVRGRMVGDGTLLAAVRSRADELGVEVLGGRDDVAAQLARADVLLCTSVPEGEGMPGVLIEAAMSGLPVVTTAVPGADDVVLDGRTGVIVAPGDFDGLVRACAVLLQDGELTRRMGAEARAWATETFTLGRGASMWEQLFHELLAGVRCREAS